jgi:enamine deaminase RidA (YjgF/YER057c/UK114 family)
MLHDGLSTAGTRIEQRLEELGYELPSPFPPPANYMHAVRCGDLLFLAGHIPIDAEGTVVLGRLGEDLDVEAGRDAARLAALSALGTVRAALGTLDAVERVVSVRGYVNATPDFGAHSQVIDGASDLFVEVFGERGRHARIAFGVSSLPANLAVEVEPILAIDEARLPPEALASGAAFAPS